MATLTTPLLGLPYPDGAERVMDGDNAIGALALAIDAILGRQENPPAAIASGVSTATAAGARVNLNGAANPASAATVINSGLTIGAGKGGVYVVIASGVSAAGAVGSDARVTLRQGAGATVRAGSGPGVIPGASVRWECSAVLLLAPGEESACQAEAAWTHTMSRFQIIRVGGAYGLLAEAIRERDQIGATPAEEELELPLG